MFLLVLTSSLALKHVGLHFTGVRTNGFAQLPTRGRFKEAVVFVLGVEAAQDGGASVEFFGGDGGGGSGGGGSRASWWYKWIVGDF